MITFRLIRFMYTVALTAIAFIYCGTLAGALMILVQFDVEYKRKAK